MFLKDGVQVDELFGDLIKSGAAIVVEREVRCYDGYQLSCPTVSNFAVEAKLDGEVSYTNLETTPIDVSAFAGIDKLVQFRFTPTATKGVFDFDIRLGPA